MMKGRTAVLASLAIGVTLFVVAAYADTGTVWLTLFGVDFGISTSGGNINFSKASGGFFHWWEAFAEREYQPKAFGIGYVAPSFQERMSLFPSFASGFGGKMTVAIFPVWMVLDTMAVWIAVFSFRLTCNSRKGGSSRVCPK